MVYVDAFKTVGCVDCFILSTLRGHPGATPTLFPRLFLFCLVKAWTRLAST